MRLEIFSVYDGAAKAFITPFFLPTIDMAVRSFTNCCNDPTHAFCINSVDYTMFHLGSFNDSDGVFSTFAVPEKLVLGSFAKRDGISIETYDPSEYSQRA